LIQPLAVVIASCLVGVALALYTGFLDDDAFITFRYARSIAEQCEFAYNLGEPLYGTTSPLFALLLAGLTAIHHSDIPASARIVDLLAATAALLLLWLVLRRMQVPTSQQLAVLVIVGLSPRLWYMNTQGMETPLVLLLMVSSWYAATSERYVLAGLLGGLLLWTRIDSAVWVVALSMVLLCWRPRASAQVLLVAAATYLPWVAFATLYFGTPIPHTVIAKWFAYVAPSKETLLSQFAAIGRFLAPLDLSANWERVAPLLATVTITLASVGGLLVRKRPLLLVLPLFIVLDALTLAVARAGFFNRYFVPILWSTLVLAGLGIGAAWDRLAAVSSMGRSLAAFLVAVLGFIAVVMTLAAAREARDGQTYRNDASLKAIGLWLNAHTPADTTVLLEPLGYIGYYSGRRMIDTVGLVAPQVVDLKRSGVSSTQYPQQLHPDYAVVHCDDATERNSLAGEPDHAGSERYVLVKAFDPLGFNAQLMEGHRRWGLARDACYEIWERISK